MTDADENKRIVREFIQTVWVGRNPAALGNFRTDDCVNHAMPRGDNRGLETLRAYHESFLETFAAFSNVHISILQQIAEGDRVASYIEMRGEHTGVFAGIPPTAKSISTTAIRIDRLRGGKLAEHWSVSDFAGLMQQLQA